MAEEKKSKKNKEVVNSFPAPLASDYQIVGAPVITEKSMALLQNANKVTVKVAANSNKVAIKKAFERLYQVKVDDVCIVNQIAKKKSRGGRYPGHVSGYKKAIISLHEGSAIDLFKE